MRFGGFGCVWVWIGEAEYVKTLSALVWFLSLMKFANVGCLIVRLGVDGQG